MREKILSGASDDSKKSALLAVIRAFNAQRNPETIKKYMNFLPLSSDLRAYLDTTTPDYRDAVVQKWQEADAKPFPTK